MQDACNSALRTCEEHVTNMIEEMIYLLLAVLEYRAKSHIVVVVVILLSSFCCCCYVVVRLTVPSLTLVQTS